MLYFGVPLYKESTRFRLHWSMTPLPPLEQDPTPRPPPPVHSPCQVKSGLLRTVAIGPNRQNDLLRHVHKLEKTKRV